MAAVESRGTRWPAISPTTIGRTDDDVRIKLILNKSFNWTVAQYAVWLVLVRQNPVVFDLNDQIELFRESFYIASDLLELQHFDAAFSVLCQALGAIPDLFRNPHPELLFSLVEVANGINMPQGAVHAKVKAHVADLAAVMLGRRHPLTILLKSQFDAPLQNHVIDLVFTCIIESLSKTFGRAAYQTTVQQLGQSQWYGRNVRQREGQALIAHILAECRRLYGASSALTNLAELELNSMRLAQCAIPDPAIQAQVHNSLLRVEVMSGVYRDKFTSRTSVAFRGQSPLTLALAQLFLRHKRYTFALHCYHMSINLSAHNPRSAENKFHDRICDTVLGALRGTLSRDGGPFDLPLQAAMPGD